MKHSRNARRKLLALVVSLAFAASLCISPTALAAPSYTAPGAGSLSGSTAIVYSANLRGDLDAFAKVKTVAADYEAAGADVIIVDAGNFYQGSHYAAYDMGQTVLKTMREVGYDVVVPGTNDFSFGEAVVGSRYHFNDAYGFATLKDNLFGGTYIAGYTGGYPAGFPTTEVTLSGLETLSGEGAAIVAIASNISGKNSANDIAGNGRAIEAFAFEPSAVSTTASGKKIGFVGLANPNAAQTANAAFLNGLEINAGTEPATSASAGFEADFTICLSNLDEAPAGVEGTDMLINVAPCAYGEGETLGVVVLDAAMAATPVEIDLGSVPADATVQGLVDAYKATVDNAGGFFTVNTRLSGTQAEARGAEMGIGDLYADAMKWYALNQDDVIKESLSSHNIGADDVVAFINGGNLRDNLYEGEAIVATSLRRIEPFPNSLSVVYVTGSQLLEQLEAVYQGLPYSAETDATCASFFQVSGIQVNVDTSIAFDANETPYGKNWYGVNSVKRTSVTSVNGQPLDPEKTYAVITSDKIAVASADPIYYVFKEQATDVANSDVSVNTAVLRYVQSELGGAIAADSAYTQPQGRITFGPAAVEPTSAPMLRLYNPNSGEHFYTASVDEHDALVAWGWNDEGIGWYAPADDQSVPVYRLYNQNGGEHHYTIDTVERDTLVALGWNDEGIGWYSDPAQTVVLLREYNPNVFANNHNYTTDQTEHDTLIGIGWKDEGTAWYAVAAAPVNNAAA